MAEQETKNEEKIDIFKFYERPFIFGAVLFDHFKDTNTKKLGGAPFNVAWNLQGLGFNPIFISRVGNDTDGKNVLNEAKSWNLDCSNIQIDQKHATGTVAVTIDKNTQEPSFEIVENVAFDFIDENQVKMPDEFAVDKNVNAKIEILLYHGSVILRNNQSKNALYKLIQHLETKYNYKVSRFVDVNLRAPYWELKEMLSILSNSNVEYVKINEDEMSQLWKTNYKDSNDIYTIINDSINFANEYNLKVLITTLGANGSVIINKLQPKKTEILTIKVGKHAQLQTLEQFQAKYANISKNNENKSVDDDNKDDNVDLHFVDSVGAGDGYASVMVAGIISNWSMIDTMNKADKLACRVVGTAGALIKDDKVYQDMK